MSRSNRVSRRVRFGRLGLLGLGVLLLGIVAVIGNGGFRKPVFSAAATELPVVGASQASPLSSQPPSAPAASPVVIAQQLAATATITPTATPAPTAATPSVTASPTLGSDSQICGWAVVVGVSALNLRREPTIGAPVLAVVPQFETVERLCTDPVLADRIRWRHVRYRQIVGWMSDQFLDLRSDPPSATATPRATPAPGRFVYTFPVRGTRVSYGPYHHDYPATDIFAPPGSLFVAPTSGWIEFVNRVDRWDPRTDVPADRGGIMLSLIGDDGVRYYGSHLQSIVEGIEVGVRVEVGQLLGYTGSSGNAAGTPPHLHFGISRPTTPDDWRTRRGELSPYPYLKAWERGEMLTPDLSLIRR